MSRILKFTALLALIAMPAFTLVAQDDTTNGEPAKEDAKRADKDGKETPDKADADKPELPEDSLYRLKTKTLEGEDADLKDY